MLTCSLAVAVWMLALTSGPLVPYKSLVEEGKLQQDANQERVASELENLLVRLEQYEKDMKEYHEKLTSWENKKEGEHRKILMQEAEPIQQNDMWSAIKKKPKKLVDSFSSSCRSICRNSCHWSDRREI